MKTVLSRPSAARHFALMALAGCASLPVAYAAQTLRYNFDTITDPSLDPVPNLAPAAAQDGVFVNPANVEIPGLTH